MSESKILIVDDIPANFKILGDLLKPEGYHILVAPNGEVALKIAARAVPDLILLDVMMPGMDGFQTCQKLKADPMTAKIPVVFVTAKGETENVVRGFREGGVDYIAKPFEKEEVLARVQTHLQNATLTNALEEKNRELQARNRTLEAEIVRRQRAESERDIAQEAKQTADDRLKIQSDREEEMWGTHKFIGESPMITQILADVERVQSAGTTSVLITGESGTGKELIARAIHFGGGRASGPFIPVNCSAIPADLAESMFFGHARGSFTGATQTQKGYFELADGGTLFLDEIADMLLELQTKLFRTLEDGTIMPIGHTKPKQVSIRVVAATNADLTERIAAGTFRRELYFRLSRFPITIPPLRERKADISLLVSHFLDLFAIEMGRPKPTLSTEADKILTAYDFPGNIRELKNIIEAAIIRCDGTQIEPKHLHLTELQMQKPHAAPVQTSVSRTPAMDEPQLGNAEALAIKRALSKTDGDPEAAAQLLGISPSKVYPYLEAEDIILAYVRENGSISNAECRQLLSVGRYRVVYLLEKMCKKKVLVPKGASRAVRYYLPVK